MADNVNKPQHYSGDGIECIDVIEAFLGPYGFRAFCQGNVLKYSWRHRQKNGAEDLAKAEVYRSWAMAGTAKNRGRGYEEEAVQRHAVETPLSPAVEAMLDKHADDDTPEAAINWETGREHLDGTP